MLLHILQQRKALELLLCSDLHMNPKNENLFVAKGFSMSLHQEEISI